MNSGSGGATPTPTVVTEVQGYVDQPTRDADDLLPPSLRDIPFRYSPTLGLNPPLKTLRDLAGMMRLADANPHVSHQTYTDALAETLGGSDDLVLLHDGDVQKFAQFVKKFYAERGTRRYPDCLRFTDQGSLDHDTLLLEAEGVKLVQVEEDPVRAKTKRWVKERARALLEKQQ